MVEGVALELAARVGAGGPIGPLRNVARFPAARDAVRRQAESDPSFEMAAAWELLRTAAEPANRPAAVAKLAALAATERQAGLIRSFYGEGGPSDLAEHVELLRGWPAAGRTAPVEDFRRAIVSLADLPLAVDPGARRRPRPSAKGRTRCGMEPGSALGAALRAAAGGAQLRRLGLVVKAERSLFAQLPGARREEVRRLPRTLPSSAGRGPLRRGARGSGRGAGPDWLPELGAALGAALDRSRRPRAPARPCLRRMGPPAAQRRTFSGGCAAGGRRGISAAAVGGGRRAAGQGPD